MRGWFDGERGIRGLAVCGWSELGSAIQCMRLSVDGLVGGRGMRGLAVCAWAELGSAIQCMRLSADGVVGGRGMRGLAVCGWSELGSAIQCMRLSADGLVGGGGMLFLPCMSGLARGRIAAARSGCLRSDCADESVGNGSAERRTSAERGSLRAWGRARGRYKIKRWKKPDGEFRPANGSIMGNAVYRRRRPITESTACAKGRGHHGARARCGETRSR